MTFDTFLLGVTHHITDHGSTVTITTTFTAGLNTPILAYVASKHPGVLVDTKTEQAKKLYEQLCLPPTT